MLDKMQLLKQIQMCDLVALEANLYLDTHKTDALALAYFKKHNAHAAELRAEYGKKYGPLMVSESESDKVWEWVNSKWPWEGEV